MGFIGKTASVFGVVGLSAIATLGVAKPGVAADSCGPGEHWVDTCTSGFDSFGSFATIGIDTNLDNQVDSTIVLSGPTTIFRGDPIDTPDPLDGTDGFTPHLNQINTEIVSLELSGGGFTLKAGDGTGNLNDDGALYSPGKIMEKENDPKLAISYFDIFFEIDSSLGKLHNKVPLRQSAMINRVPPIGIDYTHNIPNPISLFNENDDEVARLVNATHTPAPEPLTILGSATALGFGALFKKQSSRKRNKKDMS
ncbi:PEP-CTERM sorting domain-containing protein [Coleofasciculus sp. E2-BRE-01]|uniref:PEP-CTERM sorting domain-containing protein n=1 Tax=Coleofasciculus sp. E2-BRE-01 TaxID=3069524 RepID=UPI0032FC1A0C